MTNSLRKSHTISVALSASPAVVYEFASDPRNLASWAPGFCRAIERKDGRWVVDSPIGEVSIEFAEPNSRGVLDHAVTLESGARFDNPMRVVANGSGSEVLFTLLQAPESSDSAFADDIKTVEGDLLALKRAVESLAGAIATRRTPDADATAASGNSPAART